MARHPLCPEENAISYSKYWYWKQPPLNPLSQELLEFPVKVEQALPFERLNDLLKPGYLPREHGWCMLPDGGGYASSYIWMPDVTVEMLDWWYIWHFVKPQGVPEGCGNLRYKIWCPQEHVDTGFLDEDSRLKALDESLPLRERRYGQKNFILESMDGGEGDNLLDLRAACHDPVEFGFDAHMVAMPESGTIIAAESSGNLNIYQFRPYGLGGRGVEMRVRIYAGYDLVDGKAVRNDIPVTPEMLIGNIKHVLVEYPNLARFLPSLYAEEGCKPITGTY